MQLIDFAPDYNSSVRQFLNLWGSPTITLSIQAEAVGALRHVGKWFDKQNWIRQVTLDVFFSEEFQEELRENQKSGCAIYFLINEGNGAPKDIKNKNFNCGRKENIINLRSLAIDTDKVDSNKIKELISELNLIPHYILESSPGKFHFYFFIEPELAQPDNIAEWKALQKFFHSLLPDMDQSMTDETQVLRVPGFYNLKSHLEKPFQIAVRYINKEIPLYNLHDLYVRLQASAYDYTRPGKHINGEARIKNKYVAPVGYVSEGGRRYAITQYIEHLMDNQIKLDADENVYMAVADDFVRKHIKPEERSVFLDEGKRRENIKQYIRDQKKWREDQALDYEAQVEHLENVKNESRPDTFYLEFPGDLGKITAEIHYYAPFLSLEMCFAGALCISGMIKGDRLRYEGSWPYINGIIIAGPGAGKSTLRGIIDRTLGMGGFKGAYPKLLTMQNTVQSLHTAMYEAGAAATTVIDESGEYLQTITSKNAPGYAKALKSYYKNASTGRNEGTPLHPGQSMSYRIPEITGCLAIWMMIQPGVFEKTLSSADMSDGFLPRFFIFNGISNLNISEEDCKPGSFIPSIDLTVLMESLNPPGDALNIKEIDEIIAKEVAESKTKIKPDEILSRKRKLIYETRFQSRLMSRVDVEPTEDAKTLINNYLVSKEKELKGVVANEGSNAPSAPVYQRLKEMLHRLLCNASEYRDGKAVVTKEIAEKCIEFQKFQISRFFAKELKELHKSKSEKEEDSILKALKKACNKYKRAVSMKEILQCMAADQRPYNPRKTLEDLVQSREVWAQDRAHKKTAKKTVREYTIAKSEDLIGDC